MHPQFANNVSSSALENPSVKAMFSKIDRRLLPLLLIAYMVAYLDRINIGYAQLQMKQTLPFDDAVYGLGAGMFFIGYFLFEVPSNLLLDRIGARKTLLRIMCVVIAAIGLFTTSLFQGNLVGSILALAVAVIGIASATPLFFALTSEYLSAGAAAGGLAVISSLGNLGPAVSPSINGLILRSTGDNIYSIYFVMAFYLLSGTLLLLAIRPASVKGLSAAAPAH